MPSCTQPVPIETHPQNSNHGCQKPLSSCTRGLENSPCQELVDVAPTI